MLTLKNTSLQCLKSLCRSIIRENSRLDRNFNMGYQLQTLLLTTAPPSISVGSGKNSLVYNQSEGSVYIYSIGYYMC